MRASYCHSQHVMTFSLFFLSLTYNLGEVVTQNGNLLHLEASL